MVWSKEQVILMLNFERQYKSGLIFAFLVGVAAYLFATFVPIINSIMLGLLVGMFIGNFVKLKADFQPGISFTGSKLLELSIIFLAFGINYGHISSLGWQTVAVIAITILLVLIISPWLAKVMKCPGSTAWLIGFGTSICGSSAIAAVSPSITKDKEDIGIALAVVNLLGAVGMIALPMLLLYTPYSAIENGIILGGTLHAVGNVAGAAYTMGDAVGASAITVKLARVAMLSPAVIFYTFLINRKESKSLRNLFNLPFYLWAFIIITISTSLIDFPIEFISIMDEVGKIILTIAMTAIGLKVSFAKLYNSGKRALGFGVIIFILQTAILTGLMWLLLA